MLDWEMMRKFLFIPLVLVFLGLLLALFPSFATAQNCPGNCCGRVRDANGQPLSGVTVTLRDSLGGTNTVSTNTAGEWFWSPAGLPPASITFSKAGYRDSTCYTAPAAPGSCGGSGSYYCESIQTQLQEEGVMGWECVDPDTQTCEPVIGGPFDTEDACIASCWQRYKCVDSNCEGCGLVGDPSECPYIDPDCAGQCPAPPGIPYELCQGDTTGQCLPCVKAGNSWTAIGCLPTGDPQEFIAWLLARAIGIAGGIAFLLMIFAGLQIITSAGDPKRLQSGKEMLTNAIIGLVVIIFAVFLLQLIGVEILKIPGFTK